MFHNTIRVLVTTFAAASLWLAVDTTAQATPAGACSIAKSEAPNKDWCESQYQTYINECTERWYTDSRRAQECYAIAAQWLADCLAGKYPEKKWMWMSLPADRLQ